MTDFEARKMMWIIVSRMFPQTDVDATSFVWMFSKDDMDEANRMPDGVGSYGYIGVARGVEPR